MYIKVDKCLKQCVHVEINPISKDFFLHRATLILEIYLRWSRDKYNINNRCIMLEVKIVRKNFTILTI